MRHGYLIGAAGLLLAAFGAHAGLEQGAWAQSQEDTAGIVQERAEAHGANAPALIRLARCESTLNAQALGDHGHSHGLVQLSDLRTGLLAHFLSLGYGSAYNAWESADYLARVSIGEFAGSGITLGRWSCWR